MPCLGGEDIGTVHPRQWSPSQRVEADVDVQHRGHRLASRGRLRSLRVWRERLEESTNDEEHDAHPDRRNEQRELAAQRLHGKKYEEGSSNDLHDAIDTRGEEGIRCASVADGPKDGWGVVIDRVLTAKLLEEENEKGDEESDEVSFAQESFLYA